MSRDIHADYVQSQIDALKRHMRASDVHYDILGVTLTIDGEAVYIPQVAMSSLSALMHIAEDEVLSLARREAASERGPY
jgi:hypothetical protein